MISDKKVIKIFFTDFWPGVEKDHFFLAFLQKHFNVVLDAEPDYLFYSVYGNEHLKYSRCIKIFFTGENMFPDFNVCDYALGFHYFEMGDRYMRFPLYLIYPGFKNLPHQQLPKDDLLLNRKFCNFVYSNATNANPVRETFFKALSKYKKVDSGGKHLNNIGHSVSDKAAFIKDYKFTIAFENSSVEGYTTEKIMEPMVMNSMPLYWGNPLIGKDFNETAFVNVNHYGTTEEAVDQVIRLDNDDAAYLEKIKSPWLTKAQTDIDWDVALITFFTRIFSQPITAAKRKSDFGFVKFDLGEKILSADLLAKRRKKFFYKAFILKNINRFWDRKKI